MVSLQVLLACSPKPRMRLPRHFSTKLLVSCEFFKTILLILHTPTFVDFSLCTCFLELLSTQCAQVKVNAHLHWYLHLCTRVLLELILNLANGKFKLKNPDLV
jgi:hypothetical protein